ncbi:hypothetical protein PHLGIDRAFT_290546 [Phlebiopsis gigantea 11061_1 CR5-6]|uniref:Uncharacterized protein n=1 Tax=Phlebiopsis gigantea (strain 11061_1 CR5-6) TaxID=745531 RepID=A0A0C3S0M0_PHLG1|nr:hypothetical protein PHLGIDRAFT_290546 [Phlebiopsis gigantea 11061_1 CR5-6]
MRGIKVLTAVHALVWRGLNGSYVGHMLPDMAPGWDCWNTLDGDSLADEGSSEGRTPDARDQPYSVVCAKPDLAPWRFWSGTERRTWKLRRLLGSGANTRRISRYGSFRGTAESSDSGVPIVSSLLQVQFIEFDFGVNDDAGLYLCTLFRLRDYIY